MEFTVLTAIIFFLGVLTVWSCLLFIVPRYCMARNVEVECAKEGSTTVET